MSTFHVARSPERSLTRVRDRVEKRPVRAKLSLSKKLLFAAIILGAFYTTLEVAFSTLYLLERIEPPSFMLCADSEQRITFDAVRGYRLTPTPTPVARITGGMVEYNARLKGNNAGFPDRDDFVPRRPAGAAKRLAVFGDSFTAAQFLEMNWPDRVEDVTRDSDAPIELLNFSVDGAGLANWWSILTRIVEAEDYDIDGVVFAVFRGDLDRRFAVWVHQGPGMTLFGRAPGWDPRTYPTSLEAALPYLKPSSSYVATPDQFEAALRGEWEPGIKRDRLPYLTRFVADKLSSPRRLSWEMHAYLETSWPACADLLSEPKTRGFDPDQRALIEDVRRSLQALGVPAMVVHVPSRVSFLRYHASKMVPEDVRCFSEILGAEFVDGCRAFAGSSNAEIRSLWLPYDGHWNQKGSDQFAGFMATVLAAWP